MKKYRKIVSLMLALVLVVQVNVVYVSAVGEQLGANEELTEIKAVNPKVEVTDDGTWYCMDLVKEITEDTSSRLISWQYVGVMGFKLSVNPGNNIAEASWRVKLTNDFVKGVNGTLVLEEDLFGPVNPNYDKKRLIIMIL